jgi:hypothetical protein
MKTTKTTKTKRKAQSLTTRHLVAELQAEQRVDTRELHRLGREMALIRKTIAERDRAIRLLRSAA